MAAGRPKKSSDGEDFQATVSDIGLTHKDIHEARQIRDAEAASPGQRHIFFSLKTPAHRRHIRHSLRLCAVCAVYRSMPIP